MRFVYLTLENAVRDGNTKNCYPDFVERHINDKKSEYVIITFNYETLVEKALYNDCRGCYSYRIDVDRDKIIDFPSYEKNFHGHLLVLKLHGSLNWAECSKCAKIHLFWSQKYDHIFSKTCVDCSSALKPILVPPTQLKNLPRSLQKIWNIAQEKIASAEEITIIGFALNDYDSEASNLIVDGIKSNNKAPNFYVADLNASKIEDKIMSKAGIKLSHFNKVCLFDDFRKYLDNMSA